MDRLCIDAATPAHALGWAPSVMLYVWRATTTLEAARAASVALEHTREATPSGRAVILGIVEPRTPPPEAAVRREIAEALARSGDFVFASALIFEGAGFQASMVRMVAAGMSLIRSFPFPHRVFGCLADGVRWLEQASVDEPVSLRAERLEALMAELRGASTSPSAGQPNRR